jgi:hypothetical protein
MKFRQPKQPHLQKSINMRFTMSSQLLRIFEQVDNQMPVFKVRFDFFSRAI